MRREPLRPHTRPWFTCRLYLTSSACAGCMGRWALNEGQDFVLNHRVAAVDFVSIHCWVDKCARARRIKLGGGWRGRAHLTPGRAVG